MATKVRNAIPDLTGTVDPSAGSGVPAPRGVIFRRTDVSGVVYLKVGDADTDWIQLVLASNSPFVGGGIDGAISVTGASTLDINNDTAATTVFVEAGSTLRTNGNRITATEFIHVDGVIHCDGNPGHDAPSLTPGANPAVGDTYNSTVGGGRTNGGNANIQHGDSGINPFDVLGAAPITGGNGGSSTSGVGFVGLGGTTLDQLNIITQSDSAPNMFFWEACANLGFNNPMLQSISLYVLPQVNGHATVWGWGAGGGGGQNGTAGVGGNGGSPGGPIGLWTPRLFGTGTIRSKGGHGGAADATSNGGGGGAGSGGLILIGTVGGVVPGTLTLDVSGGIGGAAGPNPGGNPGGNGSAGVVRIYKI